MMKATWKWIDSYVNTGLDAETVEQKLTLSGTEVEVVEPVGDDVCFTLEVTSNRTDCLSVIGLARELAACTGKVVELPKSEYETMGDARQVSRVEIERDALEHCPYYTALIIRNVKVGPSPQWLKDRLEGVGLKPKNNVVDITNFVLFETGQPLHAFDLNKLKEKRIVVRMAKNNEPFKPVVGDADDAPVKLAPDMLVIADAENPQAIGGVMGGRGSGVTGDTTDILLESAYFNPQSVKRTVRSLGLHSDSSFRFERDVDTEGVLSASRRAGGLIAEIAGGEVLDGVLEAGGVDDHKTRKLTVTAEHVARVMGLEVSPERMLEVFSGLGVPGEATRNGVTVAAPSYRRDLQRPIDLVEEVGRVIGLDQISADMRMPIMTAKPTRRQLVRRRVREALQGMGVSEALTDTFVSDKSILTDYSLFATEPTRLEARNPVNSNLPSLRRNLLGSLLLALETNRRQGLEYVRLYEVANVFHPGLKGENAGEREVVGMIGADYFDVKGMIESLLEALRAPTRLEVTPYQNDAFTDERVVVLRLGGKVLGVLGEPSQKVRVEYDLDDARPALAELDFQVLVDAWVETPMFEEPPRFPTAERDLAFVLDGKITWGDVEQTARAAANATLRVVELFDEFTGKQIGAGKKSLAFRLYFRHDERTLTNEEITAQMDAVAEKITNKLGGELRG